MDAEKYVYLHGQVLGTHSFYLKGGFLQPDEYSELDAVYFLPGGETGTAGTVLASLGVNVKLDGTHIGTEVGPMLREFYKDKSVDLSALTFDPEYKGLMDYVIVADLVRSPMGTFQALYAGGKKRWNGPNEAFIQGCTVAAIDPFFLEETQETAEMCVRYGKPFVTIDSPHDSYLHQHCAVNVVSKECLASDYGDVSREEAFRMLSETAGGLLIITSGEKDMLYGRRGEEMKRMAPFSVDVKSTLGAGDTFKAACVYALLNGFSDDDLVRFSAAASGVAISRYPLPLNPPTLSEIEALIQSRS